MKLFEIITPTVHSHHKIKSTGQEFRQNLGIRDLTKYYGPRGEQDPQPKSKLVKVLGHGAYAGAVEVKGKNEVMKISRGTDHPMNDPWYMYISRLASGDYVQRNPWFPRVYKMKVYETIDQTFKYFYIAYMEKLYPLTDLSHEELISLVGKTVQPKLTSRIKQAVMSDYDPTKKLESMSDEKLIEILVDKVRSSSVKDPLLKEALKFLSGFTHSTDITPYNIMVRRTSVGPQLVLSDPLKD